jgi:Lon protease-like protein
MSDTKTIPLFPLGLVLVPQMDLPLHIFEERYKLMIRECLEGGTEFGVVLHEGSGFHPVGCTARVVEVLKRYDDGRVDILTCGEHRFRILQVFQDKPYLEALVDFFDDEPEETTPELEACARKGIELIRQLSEMMDQPQSIELEEMHDLKGVSYLLAGNPGFQPREKQEFIEMTSTRSRLQKSLKAMEKTLDRLRLTEEIEKIIHGNGRVPGHLRSGDPH